MREDVVPAATFMLLMSTQSTHVADLYKVRFGRN